MIKPILHILKLTALLMICLQSGVIKAQEVSLSSEINIRNYLSYELLGKVNDRYVVYRDKGFVKQLNVFNKYLEQTLEAELTLEKKRAEVIQTQNLDSLIQLVYYYTESDSLYLRMRRYDTSATLRDSTLILRWKRDPAFRAFDHVICEDKSKILFYTMNKQGMLFCSLFDNNIGRLISQHEIAIADFEIRSQNFKMLLSDEGEMVFVYHRRFDEKEENFLQVATFNLYNSTTTNGLVNFGSKHRRDMVIDYDNKNNQLIICGTYSEKKGKEPLGYYIVNESISNLHTSFFPAFIDFPKTLVQEVSRSKRKKNKVFQFFWVKDVIKRQDGGLLVLMELYKEFSRRSSYGNSVSSRGNFGPNARRGWVDYYNEDIIVTSFSADKTVDWTKILYKKQFSQDDEAIFSSYFIMKTPSRLRLVYNDEIKRSNTVSEYIMDPGGWIKRNSLLSTSQQDLKLRFRDALQISSNEIIVPSETNYNLSLVKITY